MSPRHKHRMAWITLLFLGFGMGTLLVLYALRQNINLFYTPSQIVRQEAPVGIRIRVGGQVAKGSVQREQKGHAENVAVQFVVYDLQDMAKSLTIDYKGILPDLFKEEQGIVVSGRLQPNGAFIADEVLAKHDENYMPMGTDTVAGRL